MLRRCRVLLVLSFLTVLVLTVIFASPSNAIGAPPPGPIGGDSISLEEATRLAGNTGFTLQRPVTLPSSLQYMEVRVIGAGIIDVQQPWIEGLSTALIIYSKEPLTAGSTLPDLLSSGGILVIERKRLPSFDKSIEDALQQRGEIGVTRTTTVNGSVITSVQTGAIEAATINGNTGLYTTTSPPYAHVNQSNLKWADKQSTMEIVAGSNYYTMKDLIIIAESFTDVTAIKTTTNIITTTITNTTTTLTHQSDNDFSAAVAKVVHSYAVQVTSGTSLESRKLVTIDRNDPRFKEIVQYLNSSKVKAVTLKTGGVVTKGNLTTTVSVTVLYPLGNYLTFMLWNGSTVHFTYDREDIWFETDQATYQVSFDPAFSDFLNTIVQATETITRNQTDILIYAWAISVTVVLAVVLLLQRRTK